MSNLRHIAIILDGNRRFAKRLVLNPWKGHEFGAEKIKKLFDWCKEMDIREITLYCLSIQNFNRPKEEFNYLMELFAKEFNSIKDDERIMKNKIKINFAGRLNMLPENVRKSAEMLMEKTKDNHDYIFNICMAYGGQEEILDAINNMLKQKIKEVTGETLTAHMSIKSQPDLIIRTGGERRTSNFLVWQSPYSEWFFMDKMWPEFEKQDLVNIINEFKSRERRFGK